MESNHPKPPIKLLDQVRGVIRRKGLAYYTEKTYLHWIKRFIFFHDKKHPKSLGAEAVARFLTYLALQRKLSPSTQNQALNALIFLYREVLEIDLGTIEGIQWSKKPKLLPVVLSRAEVTMIFRELDGTPLLVAQLLYGCGLRLIEALRLRIKDIDFERNQIQIRDAKGRKDRFVMLPQQLKAPLTEQLSKARIVFESHKKKAAQTFRFPMRSLKNIHESENLGAGFIYFLLRIPEKIRVTE